MRKYSETVQKGHFGSHPAAIQKPVVGAKKKEYIGIDGVVRMPASKVSIQHPFKIKETNE